ncbi:zinc finger SWIM domain-containing protein 1 [Bombina bombina]|uniref:zinc finger SWIM domain-containing protein 1 n=1 Tax=Bombina bombina TaxID=8345 RepID=UPI00235ADDFF|nr:zinc finger SWIM domain-containing protein 1 [Bombina bombina]
MATFTVQKLLRYNPGSQLKYELNKADELISLSFQTSLMSKVFFQYPEMLLLLQAHNGKGKSLYIFLVDGPRLTSKNNASKIMHIAVPKNESPECLVKMFSHFKDFNPNWLMIKIFLVDPNFIGMEAIIKVFPSVEIVPSAFHICRKLQQHFYISADIHGLLVNILRKAMCSATGQNLHSLYTLIHKFANKDLLKKMNVELLLVDRVWALHRWRSKYESYLYYQNMEATYCEITQIFGKNLTFESNICALGKYIQDQTVDCGVPDVRSCRPHELDLLKCTPNEAVVDGDAANETETEVLIRNSLDRICIPAAFKLCSKELSIAVKSEKLFDTQNGDMNITLLETPQHLSNNLKSCTCYFNQFLQLPCRHILTVLVTSKKPVEPVMIPSFWRSESIEEDTTVQLSADILEILNCESKDNHEKQFSIDDVTNQIAKSLAECSDEQFQRRYNMLRELADAWIGPYEQVKL